MDYLGTTPTQLLDSVVCCQSHDELPVLSGWLDLFMENSAAVIFFYGVGRGTPKSSPALATRNTQTCFRSRTVSGRCWRRGTLCSERDGGVALVETSMQIRPAVYGLTEFT